jgi:DNA-binding CsgD family transcriptional regulator
MVVEALLATLPDGPVRQEFQARALARIPVPRPPSPRRAAQERYGGLTAREREVAALIAQGLSNRAIAETLFLSERTVESHTGHIRDKLGCASRAQVAAWAVAQGLAPASR